MNEHRATVATTTIVVEMKPVFDLAAIEHELQAAEGQRDQRKADPVDLEPAGQPFFAFPFEDFRLHHQPLHQHKRENAERHVDEKDPMPGIIVGDPAADGRTDGRRHDDGDAVDGERLRTLLRREGIGQHRLLAGRHAAAAETL